MMRRLETYAVTLDFLQDVAEKVDDWTRVSNKRFGQSVGYDGKQRQ
jgi:hypothetical protein